MSSNSALSQSRICGAWVEVLPGLVGADGRHDGPLSSAIKALGISLIARGPSGRAPVHEAIAAHSSALKAVGRLLPHANDDPNNYDEISAAIMCLFLSEKFFPTSSSAATVHARGIGELIQLRPPQFYASGTPHKLFVGFRPILILHAFDTQKSTFLGAPEWKAEPFRHVVEDTLQTLLSEACAIPAILELLDLCGDNSGPAARQAVTQFMEAINRLDRRHKSANINVRDFTPLPETSTAGTNFEFPNITVANSLSHYWAFWIICATQIKRLMAQHPNISEDRLLIDGERPESEVVTRKVLQFSSSILESTGYLMREDMKLYGTASALFPFHIARSALEMFGGSDEAIGEDLRKNAEIIHQRGYDDVLLN
ncbi:n-terminal fungal transcription regulatory domain-containing protein, partial [Colletotrichum asianum]